MKFRHAAVLALGLSLLGGTGQAQQMMAEPGPSGWYLRVEGGWNHADGADIHGTTTSLAPPPPRMRATSSAARSAMASAVAASNSISTIATTA